MGGEPVQILGFTELPEPGRIVEVVSNEKEAHQRIAFIKESEAKASGDGALQQSVESWRSIKDIRIKTDPQG